jgi:hypothetical protein
MTKIKSRNARKTCSLPRKEAQVKLGPRKVWLLKSVTQLKRGQVLYVRTIGKMPCTSQELARYHQL